MKRYDLKTYIKTITEEKHLLFEHVCYVQVERSARLERRGCDQGVWLSGDKASASDTQLERQGCGNRDDT